MKKEEFEAIDVRDLPDEELNDVVGGSGSIVVTIATEGH